MRYIVKYRKPGQIEGARLFDVEDNASQEAIDRAARVVAGDFAEIIAVEKNDGTVPYDKEELA